MIVHILAEAEADATSAAVWYNNRQRGVGDEFLDELQQTLNELRDDWRSFPRLESYSG